MDNVILNLKEAAEVLEITQEELTEKALKQGLPYFITAPNENNERNIYFLLEDLK